MHFFFDAKSVDAKDLRSLRKFYRTILYQLLSEVMNHHPRIKDTCFKQAEKMIHEKSFDGDPYAKALKEILSLTGPAYLVVDALDECRDADNEALKSWFSDLQALPALRVVITSRPVQRVNVLSQGSSDTRLKLDIDARAHNLDADIARYIEQRTKNDAAFPREMPKTVKKLKKKASVRDAFGPEQRLVSALRALTLDRE